jgi:hypothetical protein
MKKTFFTVMLMWNIIANRDDFNTLSTADAIESVIIHNDCTWWKNLFNRDDFPVDATIQHIISTQWANTFTDFIESTSFNKLTNQEKFAFVKTSNYHGCFEKFAQHKNISCKEMKSFVSMFDRDSWKYNALMDGLTQRSDFHITKLLTFAKEKDEPRYWLNVMGRLDYPLHDAIHYATKIGKSNHYWNTIAKRSDLQSLPINEVLEICKNVTNVEIWMAICQREDYPIGDAITVARFFEKEFDNRKIWNVVCQRFLK